MYVSWSEVFDKFGRVVKVIGDYNEAAQRWSPHTPMRTNAFDGTDEGRNINKDSTLVVLKNPKLDEFLKFAAEYNAATGSRCSCSVISKDCVVFDILDETRIFRVAFERREEMSIPVYSYNKVWDILISNAFVGEIPKDDEVLTEFVRVMLQSMGGYVSIKYQGIDAMTYVTAGRV